MEASRQRSTAEVPSTVRVETHLGICERLQGRLEYVRSVGPRDAWKECVEKEDQEEKCAVPCRQDVRWQLPPAPPRAVPNRSPSLKQLRDGQPWNSADRHGAEGQGGHADGALRPPRK